MHVLSSVSPPLAVVVGISYAGDLKSSAGSSVSSGSSQRDESETLNLLHYIYWRHRKELLSTSDALRFKCKIIYLMMPQ